MEPLDALQNGEAIHAFHGEVGEQQGIVVIGLQRGNHLRTRQYGAARVTGVGQHRGDDLQDGLVIVNDEDAFLKLGLGANSFPGARITSLRRL